MFLEEAMMPCLKHAPDQQHPTAKYPDGYLSEPELVRWVGWAVAIRGPDVDGLDSPKAIIRALI